MTAKPPFNPSFKIHKPLIAFRRKDYTVRFSQIPATPTHPQSEIEAEIKHDNKNASQELLKSLVENELDWFMECMKKDRECTNFMDGLKRKDEKNWKTHEKLLTNQGE